MAGTRSDGSLLRVIVVAALLAVAVGCTSTPRPNASSTGPPTPRSGPPSSPPTSAGQRPSPGAGALPIGTLTMMRGGSHWGVYVLTRGSADVRLVARPSHGPGVGVSASADGREIAYTAPLGEGRAQIRISDAGGRPGPFTIPAVGVDQDPSWAPDGSAIAFTDGKNLRLYEIAGAAIRPLTSPPPPCADTNPTWAPDGTRLAFYRGCDEGKGSGIYVVSAHGAEPTPILRASPDSSSAAWPGSRGMKGDPLGLAWSPDGASIALQLQDGSVWLVSARVSAPQSAAALPRLVPPGTQVKGFGTLAWSPDGETLAFVRTGGVELLRLADRRLTLLPDTARMVAVSWRG